MEDQAAYNAPRLLPAMAHVAAPRGFTSCQCSTCRGTGVLGRTHKMEPIGASMVVLTRTQWCPTCAGGGLVWQEERRTA